MADINNIESKEDLLEVVAEYLVTPRNPKLTGAQIGKIISAVIQFGGSSSIIDENTPIGADEAAAEILGLANYELYITPTGEIRYKLPTSEEGGLWNDGDTWNDGETWTD